MAKPKDVQTADNITIAELCQKFSLSEEALRLAIASLYPNFDTIKAVPKTDLARIAATLHPEPTGTITEQGAEPTGTLATSSSQVIAGTNGTIGTAGTAPQITELLSLQVGEEVQLVDAIAQVRNQLVTHTIAVRNTELVETLNQNWQAQKAGYLGTLNGLVGLARDIAPYTPDTTNLDAEITQAMAALEKKLAS